MKFKIICRNSCAGHVDESCIPIVKQLFQKNYITISSLHMEVEPVVKARDWKRNLWVTVISAEANGLSYEEIDFDELKPDYCWECVWYPKTYDDIDPPPEDDEDEDRPDSIGGKLDGGEDILTVRTICVNGEKIYDDQIGAWTPDDSEEKQPLEYIFARRFLSKEHVERAAGMDIEINPKYDLNNYNRIKNAMDEGL